MAEFHEPEIPNSDQSDDPYFKSAPVAPYPNDEEHRRRRWVAILLSLLVIPLLVAVALAGGDNTGTGSANCSTPDPANAPANCTTTAAVETTPILTPGNPEPPTTTDPNGGFPVVPITPPAPPSPPSYNPNPPSYNPNPSPVTPPAPPAPPAPTPPAPPSPPAPPPANPPEYDGPPKLTRSDGGQALFNLPNAGGGKTVTKCVTIKYNGNPSARVRLYGILTGTGLDHYIDFKVTRGTSSSATNGSCSGFTADSTNYVGDGAGVIFDDLLSEFPLTFESADDEPVQGDRERWNNNETHTYKFQVKLRSDNAAQGKTVGFQLRWEARGY